MHVFRETVAAVILAGFMLLLFQPHKMGRKTHDVYVQFVLGWHSGIAFSDFCKQETE